MGAIVIEIAVIFLLIGVNGFLAMSEMAIVSARKSRLQQLAERGHAQAQIALDLGKQPGVFLATIQIGITLIGILTGVFGGATIAEELAKVLERVSVLAPYGETASVFLIVLLITYLSLVLGELAPKQFALQRKEGIALLVAPLMNNLARLFAPFVKLLNGSAMLVLRLFGVRSTGEPPITEDDIKMFLRQGAQSGVFEPQEEQMVQQVFRLGDRRVSELMTPRVDVTYLDLDDTREEIEKKIIASGFSHYPLVQGGLDNLLGLVRAKDLLARLMVGDALDVKALMQPALVVPESILAMRVLEQFRQQRVHLACILDEYGGIQGVVTPTDILEALVGDLPDSNEFYDPDVVQREDSSWLVTGALSVDELKDLLQINELPDEAENAYRTLGGMVMVCLARLPVTGDVFEWGGFHFEVVDMDGRRVDRVLISRK